MIAAAIYAPLAVKIDGKSVFARVVRRVSFLSSQRHRRTSYAAGPLSPQPQGRFRLPGLLAATRMYRAHDAYGDEFAFLRVPVTNAYPVVLRANADGDALVDPASVDAMIARWSGFLQATPQWPDQGAVGNDRVGTRPGPQNRRRDRPYAQRRPRLGVHRVGVRSAA